VSQPPDFETLYRANHDPWRVGSSRYERRKLEIVLACLSRPRYRLAWDPACGTGHLAVRLAERCDQVLASDESETAVALTASECRGLDNVTCRVLRLPTIPADVGAPDLIVLSEFFYYLADAARAKTIALLDRVAATHCELLAVHWRHVPSDAWLGGAGAQQEIVTRLASLGWTQRVHHDDEEFILDIVDRRAGP
jgi:SAM-dependent methyltransferase